MACPSLLTKVLYLLIIPKGGAVVRKPVLKKGGDEPHRQIGQIGQIEGTHSYVNSYVSTVPMCFKLFQSDTQP
jgi:hypothetical protein